MLQNVTKKVEARYMKIIDALMMPNANFSKTSFAKKLKVDRQTLLRDMKTPEFNQMLEEYLQFRMDNDVVAKALSNIFAKIMEGDLPMSKWFLEYRIKLQEISKKHRPFEDPDVIDGEFQEVTQTALVQSNGKTGRILDLLTALDRELGE